MLIILDRDGVINYESDDYIRSVDDWHPLPGSLEAIAALNKAGHTVVVATNQSGIGRGYYTLATLQQIHEKMRDQLQKKQGHIDGIYFCPHVTEDNCQCRKPRPGLLIQIQQDYPLLFETAVFIGDSLRDLQAALAARCQPILVRTGRGNEVALAELGIDHVPVYDSLFDFVSLNFK